MFADIIIDISHEQLDKTFQYIIPDELLQNIKVGIMVKIPFGKANRMITGYVIGITSVPAYPVFKMKEIDSIVENGVPIIQRMIELAAWMKENYGSTMNQALKMVLPVKDKVKNKEKKRIILSEDILNVSEWHEKYEKKHASAKLRLLEVLTQNKCVDSEILKSRYNISTQTIKALEKDGIVRIETDTIYRNPVLDNTKEKRIFELNDQQKKIINEFTIDYDNGFRKTYLIHGITGSGKTLCYIELIDHVIKMGKQVIVLIPEIALTYQTVNRFYSRFGDKVSILNSRMSKGEKYDQMLRAMKGEIQIIIGPRSALFTPFSDIGLIVIDEEHENAYKSEQSPRFHARQTAIHIASTCNASVVLGSATPSIESYYKAENGQYKLFTLDKRASGGQLPKVYVEDLREELKKGNRSIFSIRLKNLIEDRLRKKEQIMLFLNKRGYAGFISCRSCGHVMKCPHCDIALTQHKNGMLVCHYCGYEEPYIKLCPECGSRYISGFRAGTQQIEDMVKETFPGVRTLRMDMDTTSGKDGHTKILSAFAKHEADILIGTQMIVKGHDFGNVTLVGILAADMSLYSGNYTATENTFQLLTQAAGRAGRADKTGDVVIQTYTPDNYAVKAAAQQDYNMFYKEEIAFRKMMKYPPVQNMLMVTFSYKNEDDLQKFSNCLENIIKDNKNKLLKYDIIVMGPLKAKVYKLNDNYNYILYVKSQDYNKLVKVKDYIQNFAKNNSEYNKIGIQFDFN